MRFHRIFGFASTSLLLLSAAFAMQEEGDIVSREALVRTIAPSAEHPVAREVVAAEEQEIDSKPEPKKILAIHYRAKPTAPYSLNDDRVVVAVRQGSGIGGQGAGNPDQGAGIKYKVLKVAESETDINEKGQLYSDDEFEPHFISANGVRFFYLKNIISGSGGIVEHEVYSISSDGRLIEVPFDEDKKPPLLAAGEELRNGQYLFKDGQFTYEAGIYQPEDAECCPSRGAYHAVYRLVGSFEPKGNDFVPDFKFVVAREWRTKD